ncbi:MAG TPA: N-acetyltransferase [Acidobacteriota bacterium]|nr:N-acetyltransferase [Acidobacteriota bacterium]
MSRVEVRRVEGGRDLRRFIRLPWMIYRDDPAWVPPLLSEMRMMFDRSRHPFFAHSSAEFFLAERDGRPAGRIAVIVNENHNRRHGERTAFFGFFESVRDPAVAGALLDAAAGWGRARGMTALRGPANYSTNETVGLLVEGFASSPSIMMPHNPPYYAELLECAGFARVMDLYAWRLQADRPLNSKIVRVAEKVLDDEKLRIRPLDMKRFDDDVEVIRRVYNDAWSDNWGFVPMTELEFRHTAKEFRRVVDPKIVLIAEKDGQPVAFCLALPDINQALKKINGRLFPFGLPRLLWHARRITTARVMALGIVRKMQHSSGIGAALYYEAYRRGVAAGYQACEFSWTLETNDLINRSIRLFGAELYKRYRIYEKRDG